jgi:uncharacterized membrane protein YkvA (DUF1232 family)
LAERLLSRGRLPALLFAVARKGPKQGQLREDVRLLQALCLAYWRGEYRAISPKALVTVVAGLLYFVSPVDAIPDWLGFGMLDDIAVLGWVLKTVADELSRFGPGATARRRRSCGWSSACPTPRGAAPGASQPLNKQRAHRPRG